MKNILTIFAVAIAGIFSAPASAATNLIANGSFEASLSPSGYIHDFYPNGSTYITGWTVAGNGIPPGSVSVQLSSNADFPPLTASDGSQFLDLTGNIGRGSGVVSDAIATVAGQQYLLTFDVGSVFYGFSYGNAIADLFVNGSFVGSYSSAAPSANGFNWTQASYQFTSDGSPVSIGIYASNSPSSSNLGVGLDNVQLVDVGPAVPEASTWAMMIAGLGFAGSALRRKGKAHAGQAFA